MKDKDYYMGATIAVFFIIALSPRTLWTDIPLLLLMSFLGGKVFECLARGK